MTVEVQLPPYGLWSEVVNTTNFMVNKSLSRALNGLTPERAYTGNVPDLSS